MFCVDSAPYSHLGLYDQVVAELAPPIGWGRYLPYDAILPEEVQYLHARGVAVLPLWNGENGDTVGYDYAYGQARGQAATAAWKALGMPTGCVIALDVEASWQPSAVMFAGWIAGVQGAGYVAGIYCNPVSGNGHVAAYQQARAMTPQYSCVTYTSENELNVNQDKPISNFVLGSNGAAAVPGFESECLVWQTWENSLDGHVDLNCTTDSGVALMWLAAPRQDITLQRCGLKQQPNHTSPLALDEEGHGVVLPIAAVVIPTGRETPHWLEVHLPPPHTVVHGWLLQSSVKAA